MVNFHINSRQLCVGSHSISVAMITCLTRSECTDIINNVQMIIIIDIVPVMLMYCYDIYL